MYWVLILKFSSLQMDPRYEYHKKGRIECTHCNKLFSSFTNLNLHIQQEGLGDPVEKNRGKQQIYFTESAKKRANKNASKKSRLLVKARLGDERAMQELVISLSLSLSLSLSHCIVFYFFA